MLTMDTHTHINKNILIRLLIFNILFIHWPPSLKHTFFKMQIIAHFLKNVGIVIFKCLGTS